MTPARLDELITEWDRDNGMLRVPPMRQVDDTLAALRAYREVLNCKHCSLSAHAHATAPTEAQEASSAEGEGEARVKCQHDLLKPNCTIQRNPLHDSVRCFACEMMWAYI